MSNLILLTVWTCIFEYVVLPKYVTFWQIFILFMLHIQSLFLWFQFTYWTLYFCFQQVLQRVLVVIAVICVPWMLLAKPILIMRNKRKRHLPVSCNTNETRYSRVSMSLNLLIWDLYLLWSCILIPLFRPSVTVSSKLGWDCMAG